MYEHNGEKYFIVDSHMHYWNAAPDNWVPGAEQYAKGWIECFHAYQGLGPPETHWSIEHFQKYSEDDLMKDVFEDGYVDVAIFQPTYLKEWYKEGFNTTERNALMGEKHPGKFVYNTRFDPRDGDTGLEELKAQRGAVRLQGRQALHRRVEQRLARVQAERPRRVPLPGSRAEPRHQEHPRAQGPDDLAAGQGRLRRLRHRPLRDRLPRAQLHRRARGAAADRGLLLHGHPGAERVRRPFRGHRRPDARAAELLRQGAWASCCSGSARTR